MLHFWRMLTHYHGKIWNASELAGAFGISQPTVSKYLDIRTQTDMIRQVQPSSNICQNGKSKRRKFTVAIQDYYIHWPYRQGHFWSDVTKLLQSLALLEYKSMHKRS
jgi:hypothetical protein